MSEQDRLPLSAVARAILEVAAQESMRIYHDYLGTEHVLIALTRAAGGYTERMLARLEREPDMLRAELRARSGVGRARYFAGFHGRLTPRLQRALQDAAEAAAGREVGEKALLLAILRGGPGVAVRVLTERDGGRTHDLADVISAVEADAGPEASDLVLRGSRAGRHAEPEEGPGSAPDRDGTPVLSRYGRDLIAAARAGKLREAIGRRQEQVEIAQALARRDRNVPVLVGEAGVGKTAIVEGLAARLAKQDERAVVPLLQGKRIIALRVADVVAGAGVRGEFEERVQGLLRECAAHPEIILFIDEIHTLVGAGHSSGNQDAAQLFKPALANGELRVIGATTPDEYQRYIARDPALERRMQPIYVDELSPEDTQALLLALKANYEERHHVAIQPEAITAAVDLSVRYLADRRLPDKALDLLDAACARLVVGERISFIGDPDAPPDAAGDNGVVTAEMVAAVVAQRLKVPVGQITAADRDRLAQLEQTLRRHITDQDEALQAVAQALRVARSDLGNPQRPKGVLFFYGPTGVGKTETARALAEVLFGGRQHLLAIDMAELSQEHMVAELIGSPPGYVDSDREGRLTGWLRRHSYSVVLLDEIEKAHPTVRKLLLGLLEDGRLTDAQGRTVNGREAIYIMTSNWQPGQEQWQERMPEQMRDGDREAQAVAHPSAGAWRSEEEVRRELGRVMSPELVNRFDRIVQFRPLGHDALVNVARIQIARVQDRLEAHRVTLDMDVDVLERLVELGTDDVSGARGLTRAVERELLPPIADLDFQGRLVPGSEVRGVLRDGRIHLLVGAPGE